MLAQRATQQALRRFAQRSVISQAASKNLAAPLALTSQIQTRPVATQKLTPADSYKILVEQRRLRPISPHLGIYRPQITWYASMINRITGVVLSGSFYIFGLGYLAAPLLGLNLGSASLAAGFAAWPIAAKIATKMFFAVPFTFHAFSGVRHLVWDTGRQFTNKAVIRTGWTVVGLSAASSLYLSIFV
ncbi:hypothetical protein V502_08567 [Pseudogymnoascus sp. VKM F-4520 (FW-2644)]|nr:hypothetical protein V502_08567 [Pseudogymnoascus sp. VKM F-4520 (FW-2644)]